MSINITPKFFATIIVKTPAIGNININPSIFATIIEHPPATGSVVIKPFLFATIKPQEVFNGDTLRKITGGDENKFSGDTLRRLCEKFSGDTLRVLQNYENFSGDTRRNLREVFSGDTFKKVIRSEKFLGDTIIRVPYILKYVVEQPAAKSPSKFLKTNAETSPTLMNTLKDLGIVSLTLELKEKTLSDNISLESTTHMNINEAIQGQLFNYEFNFLVEQTSHSELVQSIQGMYNQDELLYTQFYLTNAAIADSLSYEEKYDIIKKGLPNFSNAKTITYQINGETVTRDDFIDYYVATHLPVSSVATCIASNLGLNSKIQMQDFIHNGFAKNIGNYVTYADFLTQAFNWTSQIPHFQVNCFIRGDTLYVIMRGYEEEVFDITDLPHSRPTINRTLLRNLWSNAIETSNEGEDEIDLPIYFSGRLNAEGSTYTFSKGLLQTEYHHTSRKEDGINFNSTQNINYQYTYFNATGKESDDDDEYDITVSVDQEGNLTVNCSKSDTNVEYYLLSKSEESINEQIDPLIPTNNTKTRQNVTTEYYYQTNYEGRYLMKEKTETKTENFVYSSEKVGGYELESEEEKYTETRHAPLGNGFYSTSVYQDGIFMGSSISQGKPSQQVSQYTVQQVQKAFKLKTSYKKDDEDDEIADDNEKEKEKLATIVNTSFPIIEGDVKNACVEAMYWLNRRIEETISIDVYCEVINGVPQIDHVIDFTERVKYEENEYYLVSNTINLTPTQYVQHLELIRWY